MAKGTFDSVVASEKLSLVFVALLCLCVSVQAEANFTLSVNRRSATDLYYLNSKASVLLNCDTKTSYLINEKRCALDEELFCGCSIAIVPTRYPIFLVPTAAIDNRYSAITTTEANFNEFVVIFGFNGTNQTLNSNYCNISSLEVYRGREQAIEISHEGFSLNGSGSVEIHQDQLAYRTEEYVGELYRMNISCSGTESGCLFFKVAGYTSTTIDKFNNTVPGTMAINDNTITTVGRSSDSEIMPTNMTPFASTTLLPDRATTATDSSSSITTYIVGGGVLFLLIVSVVIGVFIGLSVRRIKQLYSAQPDGKSKSSKEIPFDTSNFNLNILESPILETTPSQGESKLDENKPCLIRLSTSSTLNPVPTHPDATVQGSAEQLYICPIMSNVCEPETENP